MVRGRKKGDDPEAPSKPENIRHVLTHEVSAETHALVREAKKVLQDQLGDRLGDDGFMAAMARAVLAGGNEQGAKHRIAVTRSEDGKRAWQDGGGAVIELSKATVERIECDAERMDARKALAPSPGRDGPPRPSTRSPSMHHSVVPVRAQSRAAPHRARCSRGKTIDENLVTLCWHHHNAIHEGKLRLTIENGEVKFERIEPAPLPANETQPSMVETAIGALVGMGFKKPEAQSFVETASAHVGKAATLNELLREALKRSPRLRS